MSNNLFDEAILLYHCSESFLSIYLLCFISYALFFNGMQTFSFPVLLNSATSLSVFIFFSIISLFLIGEVKILDEVSFEGNLMMTLFKFLLLASMIILQNLGKNFLLSQKVYKYEYDLIIVFSILGLLLLNECNDFLIFYLAIELQSLSFYILATFQRNSEYNAEAGLKYFVLGALTSGLLLFGFNLIYLSYGSVHFETIAKLSLVSDDYLAFWGFLFILISLFFKLGAFPFHQWLCDVYEGSLITITAFFSAVPKVILFGLFTRLSFIFFFDFFDSSQLLIAFSGLCSVAFASVAALYQKRLKRLMAYSAISHTGFILLAIGCNSIDSIKALIIYITFYIIMTLSTFAVIFIVVKNKGIPKFLVNWTSFASQNLCLSLTFACILFSIAGIPPLAGFYSKLCVFGSLLLKKYFAISACVAIFSSIACFYYIRLIRIFFFTDNFQGKFWIGYGSGSNEIWLGFSTFLITFFLINPSLLINISVIAAVLVN